MKHEKWANVLFLHWAVPRHLEPLLQSQSPCFELDRTPDGRAWIGLVLLTEQNVGPVIGRSCSSLLVTHHGVNVRTYVKGVKNRNGVYDNELRGIHFASLECDDYITSWGANWFGMPYRIASIERQFHVLDTMEDASTDEDDCDEENVKKLLKQNALSSDEIDLLMCQCESTYGRSMVFGLRSVRSKDRSVPSVFNRMKTRGDEATHSTMVECINGTACSVTNKRHSAPVSSNNYTVDCIWERCPKKEPSDKDKILAEFLVERYHVYTRKFCLNWRGTVTHDPWAVQTAKLTKLTISNIDYYEPMEMQPIIQYMSEAEPDSVLFSSGVGPIEFEMLRPV